MLKVLTLVFFAFTSTVFGAKEDFELFFPTFSAFVKHHNKYIPQFALERLAGLDWGLAQGNWKIARRLAAMQGHESKFRMAAWVPPDQPNKNLWPRYDAEGSHLELIWQEAKRAWLTTERGTWRRSDDFERVKRICTDDPCLGIWLVCRKYVVKARVYGVDRASHWWQSGRVEKPSKKDGYLKDIHTEERLFDSMRPDAPRKGAIKNKE